MRPWRDIAVEVGHEKDSARLLELCSELSEAFEAQTKQNHKPASPQPPQSEETKRSA